jgi:membrane-bound ClpP family serine protease
MKLLAAVVFLTIVIVFFMRIALASRHKKIRNDNLPFVGATAVVNSKLNPEGTVLFRGELWPARISGEGEVEPKKTVRIVGLRDHLLLVEVLR